MPKGIEHEPQLTEEQKRLEQSRAVFDEQYKKDAKRTGLTKNDVMREDARLEDAERSGGHKDSAISRSALTAKETLFSKVEGILREMYTEQGFWFPKMTWKMEGVIEGKKVNLVGKFPGYSPMAETASGTVNGKPISPEEAKDLMFEYLETARGRENFLKYIYKTLEDEQREARGKKN